MARSIPPANPESVASPASSSTTSTARITKSRSDRRTVRTRRGMLSAQASSLGGVQGMVDEMVNGIGTSRSSRGKGKAKFADYDEGDVEMVEDIGQWDVEEEAEPETCPITDKDVKPFPVMDLPTEIRLEIWRACLTRPYNILLSKRELPPVGKEEKHGESFGAHETLEVGSSSDDEEEEEGGQRLGGTLDSQASFRGSSANMSGYLTRSSRQSRIPLGTTIPAASPNSFSSDHATPGVVRLPGSRPRRVAADTRRWNPLPEPERSQNQDPLITNVLRASKEIYKEARSVLYSENHFVLDLNTAMQTLGHLHQRSRRQMKHVELEIPTYNEILERFQETVRLSLRYCSGLKKFIIHMPFTLPGADGSGTTGNTTVYANGFDILRWLPQECDIVVKGNICNEIDTVVNKHLLLAKTLDKLAYARRQLISNETSSSSTT
ncbi:hypothetical protein CKM354_000822100 [Cercospora kikuchii]|uniref:Uncharacterized protein n=1 Tax=Cercospora kikuchii TaxID=84275 RepID=A0A9P3CP97_9PEZI|nr:uncharacterized protein CKM354_000822100 [Cercospora kikuchii]GIZ45037.1 hypothetical protein CKM354_000822100 [Cercospora kikuchii]